MEDKRLIFMSVGLVGMMGLIVYLYLRRKKEMIGHGSNTQPSDKAKEVVEAIKNRTTMPLSEREKKELQERIKAMTLQEQEAILEVIPVSLCMHRIQAELDHAREFESMIKKAYEMK